MRPSVGASILIHDAIDFADIGMRSTAVSPGNTFSITVTGTLIKSTDSLRSLPISKRSCYFNNEVSAVIFGATSF